MLPHALKLLQLSTEGQSMAMALMGGMYEQC